MNTELLRRFASSSLLALAAFAAGCGSSVQGDDGEGTGGSGSGGGESTSTGTPTCEDEFVGDCPGETAAVCVDGQWTCSGTTSASSGEQHPCPLTNPGTGTACPEEGQTCEVPSDLDCGPATITITCVDGAWLDSGSRCLPPLCSDFADADSCAASGCKWEEPGCDIDGNPLAEAGCFDVADCTADSCILGDEVCTVVSVLPECATEEPLCDSCSEQRSLCLRQVVGEDDDDGSDDAG